MTPDNLTESTYGLWCGKKLLDQNIIAYTYLTGTRALDYMLRQLQVVQ